jgi:N6-adenosine-specific RNA methylase IME4
MILNSSSAGREPQRGLFGEEEITAGGTIAAPPHAGQYRVLYADPPWLERGAGKIKRGADRHYPLMPTFAIAALPVSSWMADDAHAYIWVTNNFLPDGLLVMRAWGFEYVTKIDWFKGNVDDDADIGDGSIADAALEIGLGQYFRGCTESCLFGTRGHVPYAVLPNGKRAQGRTGFHASRRSLVHSQKPEQMRQMIERVSPALPRLEMFARRAAPGWDVWGNEV